jgi:predicted O-methyltransferase YrrM
MGLFTKAFWRARRGPKHPTAPQPTLPMRSLGEFIRFDGTLQIAAPYHVDGNVALHELAVIANIVAHCKPLSVFEIGTFDGRTTLNIALNAPAAAQIYTLDLPASCLDKTRYGLTVHDRKYVDKCASGLRFLGKPGSEKIIQLYGDSAAFDYANFVGKMDLVFVDGSHTRAYVESDTEIALRLRSPQGIILWHDYNSCWPDVTRFLNARQQADPRFRNVFYVATTSIAIMPSSHGVPHA